MKVSLAGASAKLKDAMTGEMIAAIAGPAPPAAEAGRRRRVYEEPPRTDFSVTLQPHSYRVLSTR